MIKLSVSESSGKDMLGSGSSTSGSDALSQERLLCSQSSSNSDGFSTPKQFRHKRLDAVFKEDGGTGGSKSPAVKVPASPAMKRLGYGTGVGVFLMERSPLSSGEIRSPWAIKKISRFREANKDLYGKRLELEAEILRTLQHPNIIGYRAFGKATTTAGSTFLAMEKASSCLGDLIEERIQELQPDCPTPFPATNMERVGVDVAKALAYLHDEKKLIHGDLKSANVLIFGEFELAKLCDFGVARKIKADGKLEGRYVGTEIWNPMEVVLENKGERKHPVTAKADIYPYALTLHEMMSLKPPHFGTTEDCINDVSSLDDSGDENSQNDKSFDEDAFDAELAKHLGRRPALPDVDFHESYNFILGIFYCCAEENPEERPSAKELVEMFKEHEIQ